MSEDTATLNPQIQEAVAVGTLNNHVPELLEKRKMTKKDFVIECMKAGMSPDTAYRFIRRETNFNTETIQRVAQILDVECIDEIISLNG